MSILSCAFNITSLTSLCTLFPTGQLGGTFLCITVFAELRKSCHFVKTCRLHDQITRSLLTCEQTLLCGSAVIVSDIECSTPNLVPSSKECSWLLESRSAYFGFKPQMANEEDSLPISSCRLFQARGVKESKFPVQIKTKKINSH